MNLEHVAIWVKDLELMKQFYEKYFNTKVSTLYHNDKTGFSSYFLEFESGSRIELSNKKFLSGHAADALGYAHIAISLGSEEEVDELTERFMQDDCPLLSGPRTTGDGYYESVIQDPEGNLIELTV